MINFFPKGITDELIWKSRIDIMLVNFKIFLYFFESFNNKDNNINNKIGVDQTMYSNWKVLKIPSELFLRFVIKFVRKINGMRFTRKIKSKIFAETLFDSKIQTKRIKIIEMRYGNL